MFATGKKIVHTNGLNAFQQARMRGRLWRYWSNVTGRCRNLRPFSAISRTTAGDSHFVGLQFVLLRQIRGSEGRTHDFDSDFNPVSDHCEARWLSIYVAWLQGEALPPVELIRVGEIYYVRDGHHRISVAKALGQEYIDALVTVWE